MRDHKIPALLTSLDTLASGLATAFNSANASGFDLNGNAGGALFTPVVGAGSAANIGVAITDPALIAGSSDGSAGSNGNLANLSAIQNQTIIAGATPTTYYGTIVFSVGNDVSNGTAELQSSQLVLQQLQDQRGSISGVSLDEEAANMTQYQQAYDAAAHIATTVNQMLETVFNMGFSGTSTAQPFVADATSPSDVTYNGNLGTNHVQVGQNYSLQINQPGSQLFTSASGNVFQSISDLIGALQTNNNIGSAVSEVSDAYSHHWAAGFLRQRPRSAAGATNLFELGES